MDQKIVKKPKGKAYSRDVLQRDVQILGMLSTDARPMTTIEILDQLSTNTDHRPTLRTIQRTLIRLSLSYQITHCETATKALGWHWAKNARPVVFGMSVENALALKFLSIYVADLLPHSVRKSMEQISEASNQILMGESALQMARWTNKVCVVHKGPQRIAPAILPEVQDQVYRALLDDCQLQIQYQPRKDDQPSEKIVSPLGLVSKDSFLYLVARSEKSQRIFTMVLDRILAAKLLPGQYVESSGDFSLQRHVDAGNFNFPPDPQRHQAPVILRVRNLTARNLIDMPFSAQQKVTADGLDHQRIEAMLTVSEELVRWLLQFGSTVEVISPPSLRARMKDTAGAILRLYD